MATRTIYSHRSAHDHVVVYDPGGSHTIACHKCNLPMMRIGDLFRCGPCSQTVSLDTDQIASLDEKEDDAMCYGPWNLVMKFVAAVIATALVGIVFTAIFAKIFNWQLP
ncbi:MAG: hypothetical protein ABIH21_05800 [Patescibacteria group bacterium]